MRPPTCGYGLRQAESLKQMGRALPHVLPRSLAFWSTPCSRRDTASDRWVMSSTHPSLPKCRDWFHCNPTVAGRSEEHTSELQSLAYLVCRLLLEKKKNKKQYQLT